MATPNTYRARAHAVTDAPTDPVIGSRASIPDRWRRHRAQRQRRVIAQWLRRTANRGHDTDPIRRRREVLLHDRAVAVDRDLLEIASILECTPSADRSVITMLHALLADGCDSPLYNADIHISELRATLYHVRASLMTQP